LAAVDFFGQPAYFAKDPLLTEDTHNYPKWQQKAYQEDTLKGVAGFLAISSKLLDT